MVVIRRMRTVLAGKRNGSGRDRVDEDQFGGEKRVEWS
mgnify:CR=1 FL=1